MFRSYSEGNYATSATSAPPSLRGSLTCLSSAQSGVALTDSEAAPTRLHNAGREVLHVAAPSAGGIGSTVHRHGARGEGGGKMSNRKHRDNQEVCARKVRELAQSGVNKHCFECNQPGVTYTDITVGSFVCTSCSGML